MLTVDESGEELSMTVRERRVRFRGAGVSVSPSSASRSRDPNFRLRDDCASSCSGVALVTLCRVAPPLTEALEGFRRFAADVILV